MDSENRVVVLIDMDCFYCQVEEKLNPDLEGKPIAVVQYNPWKGGGIIAVNYVARAMGVTRHMRGDEAKEKCPEIQLPSVPCSRGKADITKYREAGKEVARVLQKFTSLLERASIDEAYLDITAPVQKRLNTLNVNTVTAAMTPNTYALGYDRVDQFLADVHSGGSDSIDFDYEHAKRLLIGAVIVSEIRAAVYEETGYRCSAGISHNKILAKLVCGMNKPNKQTVLPKHSIDILYKTLPIKKVKHLGGKFGDTVCEILRVSKMAELQIFSEKELQNRFDDKNGTWLYNIARGVDLDPVQARFNPKSIGCCKQFKGKAALLDLDSLRKWLKDLGDEIDDRLEKDALENNRTPKQMVVSFSTQLSDGRDTSSSRSYNFAADDELCGDFFSNKALDLLMESAEGAKLKEGEPNRRLKAPIKFLGISVGKFEDHADTKKTKKIKDYFGAGTSKVKIENPKDDTQSNEKKNNVENKDSNGKDYIMTKFFQVIEKVKEEEIKVESKPNKADVEQNSLKTVPVLESTLDKQESFFAKLLNRKLDIDARSLESNSSHQSKLEKPNTPVCEVVNCGDDSADTEYSSSTINEEINKSIALFEDDPKDVDRVKDIRQLMNKSAKIIENVKESSSDTDENVPPNDANIVNAGLMPEIETFSCPECGKAISIDMVETHSDYHLALRLRDEERQLVRHQKQVTIQDDKKKKKPPDEKTSKNDSIQHTSISSFFVKLDVTIPTEICSECGKRIPVENFSEHSDFHEAQRLSRELNKKSAAGGAGALAGSHVKRKRKSTSPVKKQKMPKCKSIESYFRLNE